MAGVGEPGGGEESLAGFVEGEEVCGEFWEGVFEEGLVDGVGDVLVIWGEDDELCAVGFGFCGEVLDAFLVGAEGVVFDLVGGEDEVGVCKGEDAVEALGELADAFGFYA